jgi:hypothetical protein
MDVATGIDDVGVTRPGDGRFAAGSRLRRAAGIAAAAACYLLLACLAYWPVGPLDTRHLPGCACGDPQQQAWFLAWIPFALGHGANPFFTTYIHLPAGANLAIDTAMPLLGLLGAPITVTAGPVAAYNLLLRVGLAVSGTSAFAVIRRYTSWWPAAFGGGLMFAFSPYLVGQAHRHLFLAFVPLVPLLIPLLDDWLVSLRRSPVRSGSLIGLTAGLQYLISPEILVVSGIFAAIGLLYLALRYRARVRERLRALTLGLAAAVPVFGVIAGYAIWMLLAGPGRPVGALHALSDLNRYHGDVLAPLIPSHNQLIFPAALGKLAGHLMLVGKLIENGLYLGVPLLALLLYLIVARRREAIVGVFAVVGASAFILSLGHTLTVDGRDLHVPLPFAIFTHIPLLQNIEAARLSLFVQLAAAMVAGVGVGRLWGERTRTAAGTGAARTAAGSGAARTAAMVLAGLAVLVPLVPRVPFVSVAADLPSFITSRQAGAIRPGSVVLTYPYDWAPHNQPMLWQAVTGMRFRIPGGDAFVPGPRRRSTWRPPPPGPPAAARVLLAGTSLHPGPPPASQDAVSALRSLIAASHVSAVLVDRSTAYGPQVARLMTRALRARPRKAGRLDVWLGLPSGSTVTLGRRTGPPASAKLADTHLP